MPGYPYLDRLLAMLGEGTNQYRDPNSWQELESRLGVSLPGDYKSVIDAYAPVKVNYHIGMSHPATQRWNLSDFILETSRSFQEVSWDFEIEGDDPRIALGISEMEFGTPTGLIPAVSSDRGGESIFLGKGVSRERWHVFISRDGEFREYPMDFSEWLYRYLVGEDMIGENSSAFYPGPVKFHSRPMSYGDPSREWEGPDRGM